MSVPGPVGGGAGNAKSTPKTIRSSDAGNTAKTLRRLSEEWADLSKRWETLKRLRFVRLKLSGLPVNSADVPAAYYPYFLAGRLAPVGKALKADVLNESHIEIDWFSPYPQNWWPGITDGPTLHQIVANALIWFLEDSFSLGQSQANRESWTWNEGTGIGFSSVKAAAAPAAKHAKLALEWTVVPKGNDFAFTHAGATFQITTPWPIKNQDSIVS